MVSGLVDSGPPTAALFVHDLDLLVDYLPGEPVDRHMHPVSLFAFDDKTIRETCGIRRIASALRDHVKQQVPDARLSRQSAGRDLADCVRPTPDWQYPSSCSSFVNRDQRASS